MLLYKRFWEDFCSWYLEIIKPSTEKERALDACTYDKTLEFFDVLLHLLHPFMPFITEELWQNLQERMPGESIMVSPIPETGSFDAEELAEFVRLQELVVHIRGVRQNKQIPGKTGLDLLIKGPFPKRLYGIAMRMAGLKTVQQVTQTPAEGSMYAFLLGTTECFIPLGAFLDIEEERSKIHAELDYYRKFLLSVEKKLANETFVQRAPEQVVAIERKKQEDARAKITALEEQLALL